MSKLLVSSAIILGFSTMSSLANKNELIETVEGSIITFTCPSCPKEDEDKDIELVKGSQILEMRKVGDEEKLFRTENWLGGSPVSFVHISPKSKEQIAHKDGDVMGEENINIVSPASSKNLNENEVSAIDQKDNMIDQEKPLLGVSEMSKQQPETDTPLMTESETELELRPNIIAEKVTSIAGDESIKDTNIEEPIAVMKALPSSETSEIEN